jgi:hypothetical protein
LRARLEALTAVRVKIPVLWNMIQIQIPTLSPPSSGRKLLPPKYFSRPEDFNLHTLRLFDSE